MITLRMKLQLFGRYDIKCPPDADREEIRRIIVLAGGYKPLPTEPEAIALHNEQTLAMHRALRALGASVVGVWTFKYDGVVQ